MEQQAGLQRETLSPRNTNQQQQQQQPQKHTFKFNHLAWCCYVFSPELQDAVMLPSLAQSILLFY